MSEEQSSLLDRLTQSQLVRFAEVVRRHGGFTMISDDESDCGTVKGDGIGFFVGGGLLNREGRPLWRVLKTIKEATDELRSHVGQLGEDLVKEDAQIQSTEEQFYCVEKALHDSAGRLKDARRAFEEEKTYTKNWAILTIQLGIRPGFNRKVTKIRNGKNVVIGLEKAVRRAEASGLIESIGFGGKEI